MFNIILLAVSLPIIAAGLFWRRHIVRNPSGSNEKRDRRLKAVAVIVAVIGFYIFLTCLISIVFGPEEKAELEFSIWTERVDVFGLSLSITTIYSWIAMAALILIAFVLRIVLIKRFTDIPGRAQNILESVVEAIGNYTDAKAHGVGEFLCSYVLTIGAFMVVSACFELFRLRAPTSDITMTFALAFLTFIMINTYGVKKKGAGGRLKALASPTPVVFIFRVISELAIPVSMACRLFGNMLGGMIVMDLLYTALGNGAVGIPSVAGLFFNVFHPLIQAFIFITLTLTFVNEAIE